MILSDWQTVLLVVALLVLAVIVAFFTQEDVSE